MYLYDGGRFLFLMIFFVTFKSGFHSRSVFGWHEVLLRKTYKRTSKIDSWSQRKALCHTQGLSESGFVHLI